MTPSAIIEQAAADGVSLTLSPTGTIKASGNAEAVNRWLTTIRQHKPGIVAALTSGLFDFAAGCDSEMLEERACIIAEGCRMAYSQAVQEARWQAERASAWQTFISNANRILAAPKPQRDLLITIYRSEAIRRYGDRTGTDMALSMESWVRAKGVH
jgi:hypothetical protein